MFGVIQRCALKSNFQRRMTQLVLTCLCIYVRRVGRGGAMGANTPPRRAAEKVRLEGSKDELTKKRERQR